MTYDKNDAIDYILGQLKCGYIDLSGGYDRDEINFVESAVLKQIQKKPVHIHEEHSEHLWSRNKKGEIDMFAFESGYCNGPMCTRCYHVECEHCNPKWETEPEEPCIVDEDICPTCNNTIAVVGNFCLHCGQALDWEVLQNEN